jgi:hypothetical protein
VVLKRKAVVYIRQWYRAPKVESHRQVFPDQKHSSKRRAGLDRTI